MRPPAAVHEKALEVRSPAVLPKPTTWPEPLTASAMLTLLPNVPRSTRPPACVQENPWMAESPGGTTEPTSSPVSLTVSGALARTADVHDAAGPPAGGHVTAFGGRG